MIFGFGKKGFTNLLTRALADVGEHCDTIPDPAQLEYHMPGGLRIAVDGAQYVRPDDGDAVQLMESSNVLAPIVGLRQLRRRAAASQEAAAAANPMPSQVAEPEGEDERLTEPPEFVVDALAAARAQLAAVNSQRIRYDAAVQLPRASEAAGSAIGEVFR